VLPKQSLWSPDTQATLVWGSRVILPGEPALWLKKAFFENLRKTILLFVKGK
jgi:hypothetical protein